jgi:oxaloacetate decarboxylase alpha subunit
VNLVTKKIKITETILRDAHQSFMATRMTTPEMLKVAEELDKVGYYSLEAWGGATFDSCIRYLNEDPWERLRQLRARVKNTKLQMLLRGQNLLGYSHYADDVVEKFVAKSIENGIDIIRIFDALNDVRNLETAMKATKKYGGHAQATVVYTTSPVHNIEHYVNTAKKLEDMGADSLCLKDMAGLLTPYETYDLIKALKENVDLPIQLHSHCTTGLASMTYLKAIEAGVDVVDTALSALGGGSSQPPTESLVATLRGTEYDPELDIKLLTEINRHFKQVRDNHKDKLVQPFVNAEILQYQIPGGMLSNFFSQLSAMKLSHKIDEALAEVPRVRKALGYPPLVTPTSQIVGTQATMNVVSPKGPWSVVPLEVKRYLQGEYGTPPGEIDEEFRRSIIGDAPVITDRPANHIPPAWDDAKAKYPNLSDEEILSRLMFPDLFK